MKSKKEKELDVAKSKFIKAFNFAVRTLRSKGMGRKVALGLAFMALIGGRASIRNAFHLIRAELRELVEGAGVPGGRLEEVRGGFEGVDSWAGRGNS